MKQKHIKDTRLLGAVPNPAGMDVNINVTHCPSHINKNCCCDGVRLGVILKDYFIRSRGAQINDSLQRDSNMGCAG
jgi:hypothetical protein